MVWCDYPTTLPVQEEHATWTVLSNVSKMGTQALWCIQCPSNCIMVEHNGTDAISHPASSVEEFDYEGHTSSLTPRKRVPLGQDFQAELPDRIFLNSKRPCRSDCEVDSLRWLGECVWPKQEARLMKFEESASRVSHQECSCELQDSLECVRLHIKEKRKALKAELGEAFYMWGFQEMGEVVAEKWTHEEQSTFQELVQKNPESFWPRLYENFPARCMTDLVSYYFNVFVLRRRAIQNRVNPDNIDSDDDEMVLDSDERDSESMLESNEEDQSQLGYDAASEDEEENWPVEDGPAYEKLKGNVGVGKLLQDGETPRGEESTESSIRAGSTQEQMISTLKESSSDCCCGTSNEEDRGQAMKTWELLAWDHKSHVSSNRCVVEQSEKEAAWASPSLRATQEELISTKGMMEEFFGSEICEHPK
eukprot:c23577_g1_i1 orf=186-1448(+)